MVNKSSMNYVEKNQVPTYTRQAPFFDFTDDVDILKKSSIDTITPEHTYLNRRHFIMRAAGLLASGPALISNCNSENIPVLGSNVEPLTSFHDVTHYNNYYEFSTNKEAVAILAQELTVSPWSLTVDGEVENAITIDIQDLIKQLPIRDATYRLRCVEGWSMFVPWQGFSLCELLKMVKPTAKAKYVQFIGLLRPSEMIGQRRTTFQWPYLEALRLDEAMSPLTLMATGLYGKPLPKQNGAPLRLLVPWKYAFKSIKSITHIKLVEKKPETSWMLAVPSEYGFYANVNPDVAHPRWSQRREVRIGEIKKRKTLPFNGYAEDVAHLYTGMDLTKNF